MGISMNLKATNFMTNAHFLGLALTLILTGLYSCKKDKLDCDGATPNYGDDIKMIIDASCALSGCHGSSSFHGVFTTYDGLEPYLLDGQFSNRVLITQDMPKGSSLTQEEIILIQCWVDNNYAEN